MAEQQGQCTQEHCSAMWLTVLGFMVMELVSGLSLSIQSDLGFLLVARTSLCQDRIHPGGF